METSNAVERIATVVIKTKEVIDKIKETYEKFISRINKLIVDLEHAVNEGIKRINNGLSDAQKWLEMKTEPITISIREAISGLKRKINDIIDGLRQWYNKVVNSIKIAVIKSTFAKIGQESPSDDVIKTMAQTIPHPDITSFLPNFDIELEIPDFNEIFNVGQLNTVSIPRIPMPFGIYKGEEPKD